MSKKFEDAVKKAIKDAKTDDNGKITYPDGTDSNVIYAANLEKRRRDTQASFVKEQQRAERLETENTKLAETWEAEVSKTLTQEQRDELDELKNTDPEAWREKLNKYEASNKEGVKERRKKIAEEAGQETELQRRTRLLQEHNEANPDFALSDEVIENDLPPRITKKLAQGEISFEDFLAEANEFLGKPKVVGGGETPTDDPDLSDAGGHQKPTEDSIEQDIVTSYKNEVY